MFRFCARATTAALVLSAASVAHANDTQVETALGGLVFKQSESIRMDSEDLYVSRDRVRVRYRFTNTSDAPVETLVAFPLPDIPPYSEENKAWWSHPAELKFRTTVDGAPVPLDIVERAMFRGRDVTARLESLKIPLNYRDQRFDAAVGKAPEAERRKLVSDGLLIDEKIDDRTHNYQPQWAVRTLVTRKQTFPAKTTVAVEHDYAPLAGGSVGGNLSPAQRRTDWFREEARRYCIDRPWLASFDRRAKKSGDDSAYSETWLGYVLTTGANWKGPIGDFRLVVDKGKPDSLVSFCAEGVRKISDTQFEVRHRNFTPKRDLDVLIVDWLK